MKAIVHYTTQPDQLIVVGRRAIVWPIDHTSPWVSNTRVCYTSTVQSKEDNGCFETLNSRYVPVQGEE